MVLMTVVMVEPGRDEWPARGLLFVTKAPPAFTRYWQGLEFTLNSPPASFPHQCQAFGTKTSKNGPLVMLESSTHHNCNLTLGHETMESNNSAWKASCLCFGSPKSTVGNQKHPKTNALQYTNPEHLLPLGNDFQMVGVSMLQC